MGMEALILSGGKNRRMNGNFKGNLIVDGDTILDRLVSEMKKRAHTIWLSYGDTVHEERADCRILTDVWKGCGPMGGLYTGLTAVTEPWMMTAACDMPFLRAELYDRLAEEITDEKLQAVVPAENGQIHPMAAMYHKSAGAVFERYLKNGNYKLRRALAEMNVCYVDVSEEERYIKMLRNVNTPAEYRKAAEGK